MESYNNVIRSISLNGLDPIKEIIFPANNPPDDILINSEIEKHEIVLEEEYAYVNKYIYKKNSHYFRFPYNKILYHHLKCNNNIYDYISIFNNDEKFSINNILLIDEFNNEIYFEFNISSLDSEMLSQLKNGLLAFISHQSNIHSLNPIILICKLK